MTGVEGRSETHPVKRYEAVAAAVAFVDELVNVDERDPVRVVSDHPRDWAAPVLVCGYAGCVLVCYAMLTTETRGRGFENERGSPGENGMDRLMDRMPSKQCVSSVARQAWRASKQAGR